MTTKFSNVAIILFTVSVVGGGCSKNDESTLCYISSLAPSTNSSGSQTFTYENNKLTGGTDFIGTYAVKYDQQNRISEFDYTNGIVKKCSYGSNNFLSGITIINTNDGTIQQTQQNTYNSTGQIIKQKYVTSGDSSVYLYSYSNTTTLNYNSAIETYYSTSNTPAIYIDNISYEYDNNVNPNSILFPNFRGNENNLTKQIVTVKVINQTQTETISYTYDSKGYPLTAIVTESGSSPTTWNYTYTNCK